MTRIHTVKNPFFCREGQFGPGRKLVIGLDVSALKSTDEFCCYIGKRKNVSYTIDTVKAMEYAEKYQSFWKNKDGKLVAILPLEIFDKKEIGKEQE